MGDACNFGGALWKNSQQLHGAQLMEVPTSPPPPFFSFFMKLDMYLLPLVILMVQVERSDISQLCQSVSTLDSTDF